MLGRSKKLLEFIDTLGIDKSTEIYSINHPTQNDDRIDFFYSGGDVGFRIITCIQGGKYLSYQFQSDKFLRNTLNGITTQSYMKVNDSSSFHQDLLLFEEEVKRLNRRTLKQYFKDLLNIK